MLDTAGGGDGHPTRFKSCFCLQGPELTAVEQGNDRFTEEGDLAKVIK